MKTALVYKNDSKENSKIKNPLRLLTGVLLFVLGMVVVIEALACTTDIIEFGSLFASGSLAIFVGILAVDDSKCYFKCKCIFSSGDC